MYCTHVPVFLPVGVLHHSKFCFKFKITSTEVRIKTKQVKAEIQKVLFVLICFGRVLKEGRLHCKLSSVSDDLKSRICQVLKLFLKRTKISIKHIHRCFMFKNHNSRHGQQFGFFSVHI